MVMDHAPESESDEPNPSVRENGPAASLPKPTRRRDVTKTKRNVIM